MYVKFATRSKQHPDNSTEMTSAAGVSNNIENYLDSGGDI